MNPKISIVVPTFNRCYILWKTIQSIQAQSYSNWELHIIDDGSTDNTKELVQQFKEDIRIHYHYQPNSGPAVARNLGMTKSTGEIITFIDSDDPVYSYYLTEGVDILKKNNDKSYALSHCDFFYELYNDKGECISRKSAIKQQSLNVTIEDVFHWKVRLAIGTGLFILNNKFKDKACWNKNIFPGDDIEFVMQLASIEPNGFIFITRALFEYKQKYGGDGICSNVNYAQWAKMFQDIYDLHKNDVLMTHHHLFLEKVRKYQQKQREYEMGIIVPPYLKYFPEYAECY